MLVLVAFAIVMIGFAQPPTWLLVPVFIVGARISRPRADGEPTFVSTRLEPQPAP
jgi:hypothetical protein